MLRNPARAHVLSFLQVGEPGEDMRDLFAARRVWRDPPLSTEGFWREKAPVRSFAADERFLRVANLLFQGPDAGARRLVRAQRYFAVDLFDWLDALGRGARGQRAVSSRSATRAASRPCSGWRRSARSRRGS